MTLQEIVNRVLRAHIALIAVCVAVPVALAAFTYGTAEPQWRATVRLQVGIDAPTSSTEAEALNGGVLAVATAPTVLAQALEDARMPDAVLEDVAEGITAERLGVSAVVDLGVVADDPERASRLAAAVGDRVLSFMNERAGGRLEAALADVDDRIRAAEQARDDIAERLAGAQSDTDSVQRETLRVALAAAESRLNQLASERSALSLADTTRERVAVVGTPAPFVERVPSGLVPGVALALLLGEAIGVTVAATIEVLRPRVPGVRALARALDAPVLGRTSEPVSILAGRIARAARRRGLETVVLVGPDGGATSAAIQMAQELAQTAADPVPEDAPAGRRTVPSRGEAPLSGAGKSHRFDEEDADELLFGRVRFTTLPHVGPHEELSAGVVVVAQGPVPQPSVEQLQDVLDMTRWPVVGVVDERPGKDEGR